MSSSWRRGHECRGPAAPLPVHSRSTPTVTAMKDAPAVTPRITSLASTATTIPTTNPTTISPPTAVRLGPCPVRVIVVPPPRAATSARRPRVVQPLGCRLFLYGAPGGSTDARGGRPEYLRVVR